MPAGLSFVSSLAWSIIYLFFAPKDVYIYISAYVYKNWVGKNTDQQQQRW